MTSGRGGGWLWSRRDGTAIPLGGEYVADKQWDNHAVTVTLPT
jgi:hypothetical protein